MTCNPYILYNIQYWALESINPNTSNPQSTVQYVQSAKDLLGVISNINSYHKPNTNFSAAIYGEESPSRSTTQYLLRGGGGRRSSGSGEASGELLELLEGNREGQIGRETGGEGTRESAGNREGEVGGELALLESAGESAREAGGETARDGESRRSTSGSREAAGSSAVRRTVEGRAVVARSVVELALLEGETGGRGEAAGEATGELSGEAAGNAAGEAARRRAIVEVALVEGEAGGDTGGSAAGSAAGEAARWGGHITGGAGERRGTLGQLADEGRRTLGQGEGAAHHSHSSDTGVLHCDWYGLIGKYKVKNGVIWTKVRLGYMGSISKTDLIV